MMTFDHTVKVNGKWYKAGEKVEESSVKPALEKPVEQPKEIAVEDIAKRSNNNKRK